MKLKKKQFNYMRMRIKCKIKINERTTQNLEMKGKIEKKN